MLYIFAAGILWGIIGVFVKELALLGADSSLTVCMRMFFAFVIMLSVSVVRHGRRVLLRDWRVISLCVMLGLVCHGVFNLFYTYSIKANGMGIACVLMYTAPVFTAIASGLIFHERFTFMKVIALLVNMAGCVLTVTGGDFSGGNISWPGVMAGIGSGFCYGMAAVIGRLAGERTDALIMSAYSYLSALIFLSIFTLPDVKTALNNPVMLWVGFLYGLIPTSLAYLVYYIGLGKIHDTGIVPVIASVEPVTAVLIGMVLYHEQIGAVNFAGVAVVFVSIIIIMKANKNL